MPDPVFSVLHDVFGYPSFRPGQEEVIRAVLSGRDVFCLMPTGAGKSVCYTVPALLLPGLTVVVSPLISLMQDQVRSLRGRGIPADCLHSHRNAAESVKALEGLRKGRIRILYLSPERLGDPRFLSAVRGVPVPFFCVDEAHCLTRWGRTFRPAYRKIPEFLGHLPVRPVVAAFTATAAADVREDICRTLSLIDPFIRASSPDRPNLFYGIERTPRRVSLITERIRGMDGACGIVYCLTRAGAENIRSLLAEAGVSCAVCHGGMPASHRALAEESWLRGDVQVMAATSAFGMGIDKPDVRFVFHLQMPPDPESYYQEAGRAGRDGQPAVCLLFYDPSDLRIHRRLIGGIPDPAVRRAAEERLRAMRVYAAGGRCLRQSLLLYFGEKVPPCGRCSVCRTPPFLRGYRFPKGREDPDLFRELSAVRKDLAKELRIPPQKLASNRFLHTLALERPLTLPAFLLSENVSVRRAVRTARPFLTEIRTFCGRETHILQKDISCYNAPEKDPRIR